MASPEATHRRLLSPESSFPPLSHFSLHIKHFFCLEHQKSVAGLEPRAFTVAHKLSCISPSLFLFFSSLHDLIPALSLIAFLSRIFFFLHHRHHYHSSRSNVGSSLTSCENAGAFEESHTFHCLVQIGGTPNLACGYGVVPCFSFAAVFAIPACTGMFSSSFLLRHVSDCFRRRHVSCRPTWRFPLLRIAPIPVAESARLPS